MPDEARSPARRKAEALAMLEARHADAWVASADPDGTVHLVPLSYAWDGQRLVLAVHAGSVTARAIRATGVARLGLGTTRDVVMVDAVLDERADVGDAPAVAEQYAGQADWDPRGSEGYLFLLLRLRRVQVWREADEIPGRTVMRDGDWLV